MSDAWTMAVPALATVLLQFLWQGTVLGLAAGLALGLLRNARPQARYAVACLALLACMLLPAWSLAQALAGAATPAGPVEDASRFAATLSQAPATALRTLPVPSAEALPWIVALWASGVATLSMRMGVGLLWVRRLRRIADHPLAVRWQACVDRLAPRLGIRRPVALRVSRDGASPFTAGWWRPVVLLPLAVATRMPADLIEALVAHELAHVRRHDYLVNLLQGVVEALLFYHPVVWWLSRRIRIERELVADDLAAAALGDRRRLAIALAELDRLAPARSPVPLPHFAPAAHGGHLMSRIQQLVRPQRRALAGAIAIPLVGLAVAGAAFYAHAQRSTPAEPAAAPPSAKALPSPMAKRGAPVLDGAAEPRRDRSPFALVEAGGESIRLSGDTGEIDDIRGAQAGADSDFLWFRRDGKAWVVRDAQTLARARQAWSRTDALHAEMQALEARMHPHNDRMEALGARMEALSKHDAFESPEAKAASATMETLGEKMGAVAARQAELALRMSSADQGALARLEAQQEALEREQEAIERQLEQHTATLEAISARMAAQHEPMEALAREMAAASRPMEAIGREMEALGRRVEREAELADAQVRKLLEEAYRNGHANPAPVRR